MKQPRVSLYVTVSPDLKNKLKDYSERNYRPMSIVITDAIKAFLDEAELAEADN